MASFSRLASRNRNQPRPHSGKSYKRFVSWLLPSLLVFGFSLIISLELCSLPVATSQQYAPGQSPGTPGQPPNPQGQPPKANPLDEAIRLMNEGARTYQQVKDYTCTLVKQERVKGQLQQENIVSMKFRTQPFSVYMKWHGPQGMANQEVAYVHGRNKNMMRVRPPGVIGKLGFISIAPNDPKVLEHTRHTILEAGMGHLMAHCLNNWQQERNFNRTKVDIAEFEFNKARCWRIEVAMLQYVQDAYCWRTVVYLDKQTHLPVRIECYDWPRQGGPPQGDLLEVYSYVNLQFNVGLTDRDFDY